MISCQKDDKQVDFVLSPLIFLFAHRADMRGELPSVTAAARRLKNWVFDKLRTVDSAYVRQLW